MQAASARHSARPTFVSCSARESLIFPPSIFLRLWSITLSLCSCCAFVVDLFKSPLQRRPVSGDSLRPQYKDKRRHFLEQLSFFLRTAIDDAVSFPSVCLKDNVSFRKSSHTWPYTIQFLLWRPGYTAETSKHEERTRELCWLLETSEVQLKMFVARWGMGAGRHVKAKRTWLLSEKSFSHQWCKIVPCRKEALQCEHHEEVFVITITLNTLEAYLHLISTPRSHVSTSIYFSSISAALFITCNQCTHT